MERLQFLRDLCQRSTALIRQPVAGGGGQLDAGAPGRRATVPSRLVREAIDRWVLSELNQTVAAVVRRMDAYDNFGACTGSTRSSTRLSNWYVRRSETGSGATTNDRPTNSTRTGRCTNA